MVNKAWHNWKSTPFDLWQFPLNFAIWCFTAGCGVSMRTTSNPKTPFLRACIDSMPPIGPDVSWRSCVSPFPEISLTSGTRTLTMPGPTSGSAPSSECHLTLTGGRRWTISVKALAVIVSIWSPQDPTATCTKPRDHSFTGSMPFAITAWMTYLLDNSNGFTKAGVERLNDSIRTYVWAILGAQSQTRSDILKAGMGCDAQKQFLANVEDAIVAPVDIPSSITRYQKMLQYASTPWTSCIELGSTCHRATWNSIRETTRAITTKSS